MFLSVCARNQHSFGCSSFASHIRLEPDYENLKIVRTAGDVELQKLSVVPQTVPKSRHTTNLVCSSCRSSDMIAARSSSLLGIVTSTPAPPNPPLAQDPPSSPTESAVDNKFTGTPRTILTLGQEHRRTKGRACYQVLAVGVPGVPLLQSVLPSIREGHHLSRWRPSLGRLFDCMSHPSLSNSSLHMVCVPILSCLLANTPLNRQPRSGDQQPARERLSGQQLRAPA